MPLRTVCGLMPKSADSSLVDGMRSPSAYEPVKTSSSIPSAIWTNKGTSLPGSMFMRRTSSLLVSYLSN